MCTVSVTAAQLARLHCAGSFGAAFAKLLWPLVRQLLQMSGLEMEHVRQLNASVKCTVIYN